VPLHGSGDLSTAQQRSQLGARAGRLAATEHPETVEERDQVVDRAVEELACVLDQLSHRA
jgi:hypothetical protein